MVSRLIYYCQHSEFSEEVCLTELLVNCNTFKSAHFEGIKAMLRDCQEEGFAF